MNLDQTVCQRPADLDLQFVCFQYLKVKSKFSRIGHGLEELGQFSKYM